MATQMIPVTSSMFAAVGYNPDTQEFLAQYTTGTLGAYGPTTQEEFDRVLAEPSIGKAFNTLIKPSKHYRKVADAGTPLPEELQQRGLDDGSRGAIIEYPRAADAVASLPLPPLVTADDMIRIVEVPGPQEADVQQQTTDLATRATALSIASPAASAMGQEIIVSIASMRKQVEAFFEPMKTAAHKAHKVVCDRENETLKPLIAAQRDLSTKILAYENQVRAEERALQERLRVEAQHRAQEEARLEAERLAIDDAIALEDAGDIEGAAAVLANPTPIAPRYVPAPIVPTAVVRTAGAIVREVWKARVVNPDLVPREWMVIDEAALNKHAANRKQMARVPGVEFYREEVMHGRSVVRR